MAVRVSELRGSECCPVIGQIQVASPRWDNITSPETELTSRWCSNSRTFEEPMSEAKQMTAAQAAGAASHTMVVFLHCRASWPQTSIEKVLFDVEYSRVLVFQGGVIECSSRMTGNCQVRFLEGWAPAMAPGYSAGFPRSGLRSWHFVYEPSHPSRGLSAGTRTPRLRMVCSWLRPWPWLRFGMLGFIKPSPRLS